MDEDRIELIHQLCTRIGMLLEDHAAVAVRLIPNEDLPAKVETLATAIDQAQALAAAAFALCDKNDSS